MAERRSEDSEGETVVVRRRPLWARVAGIAALAAVILLVLAIAIVWLERRPIATEFLKHEFERRGVTASYHLDRVGLRTQQVSNLVIGDPKHPDLVARFAQIQMRLKWDGSFELYRIVARGVRLRGKVVNGKISWGQIDKLLPPPSNKPFALPNFVLDIADSTIALQTPFGPLGIAISGNGKLSGGFKGRVALASPRLVPGRCAGTDLHADVAVAVVGRRPRIDGPVTLARFNCPTSHFDIVQPRFDAKASFNESFTSIDGSGRMAIQSLVAGTNGLAEFVGDLTFKGALGDVRGQVKLAAQNSRLGTIYADRTRLDGDYTLAMRKGAFTLVGDVAAQSASLAPSMLAGVTQPLAAAARTPLGPITTAIANAIGRTARNFDATGAIRVVNFAGGGGARISDAQIHAPSGARARVFGGSGVTYYWPSGGLRIDSNIEMAGGGLPSARVSLRQPRPGAPMSGVAELAPYAAGGQRLELTPIRFGPGPGGSTAVSTTAQLDGAFPNGRVQALRLPIEGRIGNGGSFAFGTACAVVSFDYLKLSAFQFGRTRLPVCPNGAPIVSKAAGGGVRLSGRLNNLDLNGSLGSSPLHLAAASGVLSGQNFAFNQVGLRLGKPSSPIVFDAARLNGSFGGSRFGGNFTGARATIGNVPLLLSDANGRWRYANGLTVDGSMLVSDRGADPPRFYPLRSNDVHLTIAGDFVRANGSLHHPATGTLVTNVAIEHQLSTSAGHADLKVPGIAFGDNLQPEELTRLTEGVIALVHGTVSGQGHIAWAGDKVTSTGDFATSNMDLAAPFGPVTGLSTSVHFTDLLGLETAPNQTATIASINPGIIVENGVIHYQLLKNQLVKVERGEWPFMGGRLILHETVLNFARPTAKRLTFEVVGLDAHTFVQSLGFKELDATGTFDGVLPMIFDESGGRIVGGRLDSRPGGGSLAYNGVVNKADLGTMGNIAFNALRDLRFKSMIIRLDGDLAGEFAAKLDIDGAGIGQSTRTQRIIRSLLSKIPLHLNVTISGPFRSLIGTAKSFNDPRQLISNVLPRPLEDVPGITTEVRRVEDSQKQTQTPVNQQVNVAPPPPKKQ